MSIDQFWDTKGVTEFRALDDGRIAMKFAGENGKNRVLTIPASHATILILSLADFASKITKTHDVGDIASVQRFKVESVSVAAATDGSEYAIALTTVDQLEAHFGLPAATAEALAAGLIATLAAHGRSPTALTGDGPKH